MSAIIKLSENIFRSRKVILEMLSDRGYDISNYANYTIDDINLMLIGNTKSTFEVSPLDILVSKQISNRTEKIYVKYCLNSKWRPTSKCSKMIETIFESIIDPKDSLIIITPDTIHFKPSKDNRVEEFVNKYYVKHRYFIQIFGIENLLFNVSHHEIVPKHELISKEEAKKMLKERNIESIFDLPTIRREDPMAKYIGMRPNIGIRRGVNAQPGDVCKITFPSLSSIKYIKYRMCTQH